MAKKLIDLSALSHYKSCEDAYNASIYATSASVPTKTSQLTNDSGFITSSDLPTVNDATLTITQNGTTVGTFSANAASASTAAITVPTNTSDLNNDSGFITSSSLPTVNDATLTITQNGVSVGTFSANAASASTVAITDTTYSDATTASAGLMSVADKTKLDGLTTYTAGTNVQINGNVISATDTTYADATTASDGLMSSTDKTKLDGLISYSAGTGIAISTAGVISVSYPNIDNQAF